MASIIASNHAVPENVVTNDDLAKFMDTSDEWIQTRSGIKERRWCREGSREFKGISNHELVFAAAVKALKQANLKAEDIDLICYATISADNEMPGSGAMLQQMLCPHKPIPIFEIRNQCSGFLYAMQVATAYVDSGSAKNVLVVGAEIQSSGLDLTTAGRNTAVLFADGAGVVILGVSQDSQSHQVLRIKLKSDGSYVDKLGVKIPGYARPVPICTEDFNPDALDIFPQMDGKFVFKMASLCMPSIIREILKEEGLALEDLSVVVPHQANQRIIDMLAHDLGDKVKVFSNIALYGNTTAASIPIALSEATAENYIKQGDLLCLVSFGAGFSWGAALIRW